MAPIINTWIINKIVINIGRKLARTLESNKMKREGF